MIFRRIGFVVVYIDAASAYSISIKLRVSSIFAMVSIIDLISRSTSSDLFCSLKSFKFVLFDSKILLMKLIESQ